MYYSNHLIKLTSISNHIRYKNNLSIIITIKFLLSYSMLPLLSQVLTIWERRRFKSIPTQLGNLFLTQTEAHPAKVASGHLWYNSGLTHVSNQRRTLRDSTNLPGRSGPNPTLGLTPMSLHTSLLPPVCALSLIGAQPELSYSASWSYHQIRPTKC